MNQQTQRGWRIPSPVSHPKVAVIYRDFNHPEVKYRAVMDNPVVPGVLQTRLLTRHVALRQVVSVEAP